MWIFNMEEKGDIKIIRKCIQMFAILTKGKVLLRPKRNRSETVNQWEMLYSGQEQVLEMLVSMAYRTALIQIKLRSLSKKKEEGKLPSE